MLRYVRLFALACFAAIAAPAVAQNQAPPQGAPAIAPVEAYGQLPVVGDAAISPDGQHLLLMVASGEQTGLRLLNLTTAHIDNTMLAPEHNKFRGVGFADDTHALYYLSRTYNPGEVLPQGFYFRGRPHRVEYWRTGILNITSGRAVIALSTAAEFEQTNLLAMVAPIEGDARHGRMIALGGLAAGNLEDQNPHLAIFTVDLESGAGTPQTDGGEKTVQFEINAQGGPLARIDVDDHANQWQLFVYDARRPRLLRSGATTAGVSPDIAGLFADGRLAVFDDSADDGEELLAINTTTNAAEKISGPTGGGVGSVITDPWSHLIVGVGWTEEFPVQHFMDPALQTIRDRLAEQFADGYVRLESWSRDRSRILVYGEHADDAGAYYVFTPQTQHLTLVGAAYPHLSGAAQLGERRSISYHARDGQTVPAYLTLPSGVDQHHLPMVVLVHGGPQSRDTFQFDWWASFLASRGYAVLQPNFRGSTGYGKAWMDAGYGQWGDGVMQTDVEDGVAALIRSGIVDPARVCIVGASYGGYAALAGVSLTPDRYKCAASIGGVSDIVGMLDDTAARTGSDSEASEWWRLRIGDRRGDRDHLRAISPVNLADHVHAPVLLIHGVDDTVVPIAQSRAMASRLRGAGKNVRLVELQGDDHWLSRADTRVQMLRELETFLAQNIGAAAPAAPAGTHPPPAPPPAH